MRDPERINRIINLLRAYWHIYPDLRLGQIISNVAPGEPPLFYLEDDAFEDLIREEIKRIGQG